MLSFWPDLAVATDNVFVAGQLLGTNRTARMYPACGNTDFRAHTKLSAIGILC
jgi:hypothetical protein